MPTSAVDKYPNCSAIVKFESDGSISMQASLDNFFAKHQASRDPDSRKS